jgi:hypothetical protein
MAIIGSDIQEVIGCSIGALAPFLIRGFLRWEPFVEIWLFNIAMKNHNF